MVSALVSPSATGWHDVFQLFSHVWHVATPWTVAHQASFSFTIPWHLIKFMSIELVVPSNHLILCHLLLLLSSIFLSIRSVSMSWLLTSGSQSIGASALHQSFQWIFKGLISFRIDWFVLLAVQGTVKSLLQHHSLKPSILQCSAFFMV